MAFSFLPPELVCMIVWYLVNTYGVRAAWKVRGIDKTYKSFIDAVVAMQPIEIFLPKYGGARTILKYTLGTHLVHRACMNMSDLVGERDFLPRLIKGYVEQLCRTNFKGPNQEYTFALMLSNQLIFACKSAWDMATLRPTTRTFRRVSPKFDTHSGTPAIAGLATHAVVGHFVEVEHFARLFGNRFLWDASYAFGYPLAAAAGGNHMEVVGYLVTCFKDNYRLDPDMKYQTAFEAAIDVSLSRRHSAMTLLLLDVYHQYLPPVPEPFCKRWLAKTAEDADDRIYAMLDTLRTEASVRRHVVSFKPLCENNSISKIPRLFDQGYLNPNQGYPERGAPHISLLYFAIRIGNLGPVEALLKLGAHPDGLPTSHLSIRPLWLAIQRNDLDMVDLLLSRGADARSMQQLLVDSDIEFRSQRSAVALRFDQVEDDRVARFNAFMSGFEQL